MSAELHSCLRIQDGARVPLAGVSAKGRLDGLLFELTVEQHYRNTSEVAIETVYTFPLPLNAALLAFELELNGTRHVATAFGRQQAERKYENAIDDGNSAALLVLNGNGLYTVTVANLKPGEEATVRYRYAELLRAHRNQVRLNLPTAIAPRYGNPADAGLEGPAIPGAELLIEYPFSLRIELAGVTDAACVVSPSHQITTTPTEGGLAVEIAQRGFLDRDFVLVLDHLAALAGTLVAADGEGFVALASAVLPAGETDSRPLVAKLLLDCSGSMAGDSIEAAKRALVQILDGLTEADRFSLTRFGSQVQHVTEGLDPADVHSIKPVMQIVQRMSADMGGTNMPEAIQATIAIPVPQGAKADLVLITDGEVYSVDRVVEIAERSGHRLFVVAIGAAPNEALARNVSERTGGACDFVAAGERVEPAILRMFGRLRAAPRTVGEIQWSVAPDWIAPLPSAVFPNDTIHLMAGFRSRPSAPISIAINGEKDERTTLTLPAAEHLIVGDVLPRLAAAQRIAALPEDAARELAIQYQLVSEHTSLVLTAERAEDDKVNELPDTIAVPSMLAAGWGGATHADLAPLASMALIADKVACRSVSYSLDLMEQCAPAAPLASQGKAGRKRRGEPLTPAEAEALSAVERRAPVMPEERQSQLKLLIALGKEQSFLTYSQVNDHLPSEIVDPEQIEDIVNMINDMGIPVYEKAPDTEKKRFLDNFLVEDDRAIGEADAEFATLEVEMKLRDGLPPHDGSSFNLPADLRHAILMAVATALAQGQPLPQTIEALYALYQLSSRLKVALECERRATSCSEAEFVRALLEHLDRQNGTIAFPRLGFMSRRRIRTLRRRLAALPLLDGVPWP